MEQELTDSIPNRYTVIAVRINNKLPHVYALVEDNLDSGQRKGLVSYDGGKTWAVSWVR